jgi:hypothetical protein
VVIIDLLDTTRDETVRHFQLGEPALSSRYAPDKWSIRFLLHHLADAETVMFERIRRILSEPRPVLWAFDQDAWAKALDYSTLPLNLSRQVYMSARAGIRYYAEAHYESLGHLEWVHSETGVRTLKDEIDKVAWHNEHHLRQVRAALGRL